MRSRGIAMCVASALSFACMAFAARLASAWATGAQIALVRFVGSILVIAGLFALRRRSPRPVRWVPLLVRGAFGATAVLLYFLAIAHVGAGLATLLNYTSPVFTALLSRAWLGEPLRRPTIAGLAIAMSGVVLVLAGGRGLPHPAAALWIAGGLVSALFSGVAVTAIRVARRTDGPLEIFASLSIFGVLATAPLALSATMPPPSVKLLVALAVVIVASSAAQLLMTTALRWVDAPTQGVVAQLAVVVAYGLGVGFLGERVTPMSLAGSLVTLAGVVLSIWPSRSPAPRATASPVP